MASHRAAKLKSEEGKALRGMDGKDKYGPLVVNALGGDAITEMLPEVRATPCETKAVSKTILNTSGRWTVFGSGVRISIVFLWCGVVKQKRSLNALERSSDQVYTCHPTTIPPF